MSNLSPDILYYYNSIAFSGQNKHGTRNLYMKSLHNTEEDMLEEKYYGVSNDIECILPNTTVSEYISDLNNQAYMSILMRNIT